MSCIVVYSFEQPERAQEVMLQLRLESLTRGLPRHQSMALTLDEQGLATMQIIFDPISVEERSYVRLWVGILCAARASLISDRFDANLLHYVPALFLDSRWWTVEFELDAAFVRDLEAILRVPRSSLLLVLECGCIPELPSGCAQTMILRQNLNARQIGILERILHVSMTSPD